MTVPHSAFDAPVDLSIERFQTLDELLQASLKVVLLQPIGGRGQNVANILTSYELLSHDRLIGHDKTSAERVVRA